MGITDTTFDTRTTEGISADEHFAEGAGNLCQALIAWMQNEEIFTCNRVRFSGIDFAHTEPVNAEIAKRHKSEGIVSTRLHLQEAAGCAEKTVTYWGPKLLGLYDQLAATITKTGDLVAPQAAARRQRARRSNTPFSCVISPTTMRMTRTGRLLWMLRTMPATR